MKILHLISQHPESTGSGYYIQNIIAQARSRGHDNFLVAGITAENIPRLQCIDHSSCLFVPFESELLDYTIPGMSDVMPYPSTMFSKLSEEQLDQYETAFGETITKAVERFSPDVIHSHHLWLVTSVARRLFPQIRIVTSCHSTDLRQFINCPHLRHRVLEPCRDIDKIMALSRDQKQNIQNIYQIESSRIDIVGGGFDKNLFTQVSRQPAPPVHLLYAGKLSYAKGVDRLLEVVRTSGDEQLHFHLAGSGSGPEASHCLELAKQCKATVTVHGQLNQQELGRLMGDCHVFILPSLYEGLPLVLLEALSTGCRIITTDLPGCRELLEYADKNLVEIVHLPKMRDIDRLEGKDGTIFEERLAAAIGKMKKIVLSAPSPDANSLHALTEPYDWSSVFERIERNYRTTR